MLDKLKEKVIFVRTIKALMTLMKDSGAMAGAILGGIMVMIIGFATLVLGNYIVFAIIANLPGLWSSTYNTTSTSIQSYVGTVIPIFGLALMVLGFAIILYTLRTSMDTGAR